MKQRKLLYLHGFNSSPQSLKAQQVSSYMQGRGCEDLFICPQIPVEPEHAIKFLEQLVDDELETCEVSFAGSSLGGFYATYLAEKYKSTAVLVNPSVKPYETLRPYLGENKFYFEDGCWEFNETHIEQLKAIEIETVEDASRYLVLLQTGDEVLDYREAEAKYRHSWCIIEQGGDHSFVGFERHLPDIMKFSNIELD
jgi:predicted esterase YcpF (UPF0227 family)